MTRTVNIDMNDWDMIQNDWRMGEQNDLGGMGFNSLMR